MYQHLLTAFLLTHIVADPCTSNEIDRLNGMKLPMPCMTSISMTNSNGNSLFSILDSNERMGLCSSPLCLSWIQDIPIPSCKEIESYSILLDTIHEICALSYSVTRNNSLECTLYDNEMAIALPSFYVWKNCSHSLGYSSTTTMLDLMTDPSICAVDACTKYMQSLVSRSPLCYRVGSRGSIVHAQDALIRQLPACWKSG